MRTEHLDSVGGNLSNPVLEGIAACVGKSVVQVIIRWHLQIGNVVIPKSVTPARIARTSTCSTSS